MLVSTKGVAAAAEQPEWQDGNERADMDVNAGVAAVDQPGQQVGHERADDVGVNAIVVAEAHPEQHQDGRGSGH